jgi:hypothetical protein
MDSVGGACIRERLVKLKPDAPASVHVVIENISKTKIQGCDSSLRD